MAARRAAQILGEILNLRPIKHHVYAHQNVHATDTGAPFNVRVGVLPSSNIHWRARDGAYKLAVLALAKLRGCTRKAGTETKIADSDAAQQRN